MGAERYLELLSEDSRRLVAAARQAPLDAEIPTCPGWTVHDCVAHTAEVYQHKLACIRLNRRPGEDYEQHAPDGDVVGWIERSASDLLAELRTRGPAAPAYTWWPADQTVGFWYRRMAQETAIHRLDVEDARGAPTPIATDLAVDGIDEVLEMFLSDGWDDVSPDEWGDVDPHAGAGRTIAIHSGGHTWRSTLGPEAMPLHRSPGPADASITGTPEPVLLWLWGRRPNNAVTLTGDPQPLTTFRSRLQIATQ